MIFIYKIVNNVLFTNYFMFTWISFPIPWHGFCYVYVEAWFVSYCTNDLRMPNLGSEHVGKTNSLRKNKKYRGIGTDLKMCKNSNRWQFDSLDISENMFRAPNWGIFCVNIYSWHAVSYDLVICYLVAGHGSFFLCIQNRGSQFRRLFIWYQRRSTEAKYLAMAIWTI